MRALLRSADGVREGTQVPSSSPRRHRAMTNIQEAQARLPIAPHVLPHARSPLRDRRFRWLWAAAVVSYTGTWLQHTAAGWLMTSFTSSPAMVALVPAASSLPVLLAILPAGAVADVCDRRRVLLVTQ